MTIKPVRVEPGRHETDFIEEAVDVETLINQGGEHHQEHQRRHQHQPTELEQAEEDGERNPHFFSLAALEAMFWS